jgi:PTS system fructose-specific IIA component
VVGEVHLVNLIDKQNIVMNLDAHTREEAIKSLSEKLYDNGFINDVDGFYQDVLQRESYTTTGIGNGIAIPHGKSNFVNETTVIFANTNREIEWNSLDGSKVKIIFLMAVTPENQGNDHLQVLAKIASKLMDDNFVEAIKQAKTPDQVVKALSK